MQNKNNLGFLSRIIEKESYLSDVAATQWITAIFCVAFFIILAVLDSQLNRIADLGVIFSQIQVFISIFLTIRVKRWGYIISVLLNLLLVLTLSVAHISQNGMSIKPMIIIPLSTIFIISIIYLFIVNYHRKIDEVTENNKKLEVLNKDLLSLNEELAVAHGDLEEQNGLLTEYNRIIKENEERLSHMAFVDMLTDLPNRKSLISQLDHLVASGDESGIRFAIAFIDLDEFKIVNDTLGHHIGDLLLQNVAAKLKTAIHPDDMLGRLGGDEFALIIKRSLSHEELYAYIEALRQLLIDDLVIENKALPVRASFGLSRYPEDGSTSSELLKSADNAMYRAKFRKEVGIEFFDKDNSTQISTKQDYNNHFYQALENSEFYLVFQPQFISASKQLRGFEVLTRWSSSELGEVSPSEFLSIAEKNGLMTLLGQWILTEACATFKDFQTIYAHPLIMSINISAVELMDPAFVIMVKTILETTGISGKCIEFEISESTFLFSMDRIADVITELSSLGIQIALDDFGQSLSYINTLQSLSIDTIKIDKSFIDAIDVKDNPNYPVASMISTGHLMNLSVLAKGVETSTQLDYLKRQQCDCIQGYLWGKPQDKKTFRHFLEQQPLQP